MRTWRVPRLRGSRVFWQALAAAVVLTFAGGAMAVAAAAPPGSPLYGLHRWEDGVRVSLAASPADRTRLHLRYATDALVALDRAVAQRQGNPTYGDALATLRREQAAAARDLAQVPAGHGRDALTAQLSSLRTQARHDLRAALGSRSWPDRLSTTSALAELGDAVPSVAHAVVAHESDRRWQVTLSGAGFQPGAVLLVNGVPMGTAHVVSPNLLTAEVSDVASLRHVALGVGNPDGTAAATESVATASETPTPGGSDDHGGQGSGTGTGKGGHGGDKLLVAQAHVHCIPAQVDHRRNWQHDMLAANALPAQHERGDRRRVARGQHALHLAEVLVRLLAPDRRSLAD
jgi:hypothetical protein